MSTRSFVTLRVENTPYPDDIEHEIVSEAHKSSLPLKQRAKLISTEGDVGRALIGKHAGDTITWNSGLVHGSVTATVVGFREEAGDVQL